MKILITGSSGFIGSHLCNFFLKKGYDITGCDIKPPVNYNYSFFLYSVEGEKFLNLLNKNIYDFCINASGSASVPFSLINPAEDFRLNVGNVNLILHAIRNNNPECRFINFSSAAVYGNPEYLPVKEDAQLAPVSPYGFHKMISEHICTEFWKLYNIRTCSLRVFSAYGPGLRKQLFWDLHQKIKAGKTIEFFGTGEESRDFIHIDDLCEAVNCIITNSPLKGEIINVASGEEISILTAVETFVKVYDSSLKFIFSGQAKTGDPLNWKANINNLHQLGFTPQISFEEGILKLVEWIKMEK
jgi:UDP-glucose 4-epimerase